MAASEDSVPALARALAELPPDRSVLEVPEGLYTIGSTWVISNPGVEIRGAGQGKTILMRDPNFKGVLVRMDGENSTLGNLTLDGNGTAIVLSLNPRFAPRAMEHVVVRESDLRGNLHPERLLDESGARDRIIPANLADR